MKINLHGTRLELFFSLMLKALRGLLTGKTFVQIKTKLPD
jgi:hypothetical protein